MSMAPFSFDRTGSIQATADGPEILVYSNEGIPMWHEHLEGIAIGVVASAQRVAVIDTDGRLVSFQAHDGTKVVDTPLDVASLGLSGSADGRLVTWGADAVVVTSRDGEPYRLPYENSSHVTFGGAGESQIGVVDGGGRFIVHDLASGQVLHTVELGLPVLQVAYSALGRWVVLAADRLMLLEETPATKEAPAAMAVQRAIPLEGQATAFALAEDGVIAALLMGDRMVWVLEIWSDRRLGSVELHRPIGELSFGSGNMLGIGLEDGEANRVNLSVGGSWRTSPGFGRGAQNWAINVKVDQVGVRGAVIEAKGGGQPVASIVYDKSAAGGNGCFYAIVGFFALGLICGGCSGVAGLMYSLSG